MLVIPAIVISTIAIFSLIAREEPVTIPGRIDPVAMPVLVQTPTAATTATITEVAELEPLVGEPEPKRRVLVRRPRVEAGDYAMDDARAALKALEPAIARCYRGSGKAGRNLRLRFVISGRDVSLTVRPRDDRFERCLTKSLSPGAFPPPKSAAMGVVSVDVDLD
jgi:hypothetical protein